MSDTTPAASVTASTAVVPPQNRIGQPTDYEHSVYLSYPDSANGGTDTGEMTWTPLRKIQITGIIFCNGDTATAATTNTTVLDIDIEDPSASTTKQHDVAALAAGVVAVTAYSNLTLSTTVANVTMENDEILKVIVTVAGAQSGFGVVVKYVLLDTVDHNVTWPIVPKG